MPRCHQDWEAHELLPRPVLTLNELYVGHRKSYNPSTKAHVDGMWNQELDHTNAVHHESAAVRLLLTYFC
jgi:hypothetical protein